MRKLVDEGEHKNELLFLNIKREMQARHVYED